jgi:hypothetical protein
MQIIFYWLLGAGDFQAFHLPHVVKLSFGTMTLYGPQIEADEGPAHIIRSAQNA